LIAGNFLRFLFPSNVIYQTFLYRLRLQVFFNGKLHSLKQQQQQQQKKKKLNRNEKERKDQLHDESLRVCNIATKRPVAHFEPC